MVRQSSNDIGSVDNGSNDNNILASELTEIGELLIRKVRIASKMEHGVQQCTSMAVGEHEAVTVDLAVAAAEVVVVVVRDGEWIDQMTRPVVAMVISVGGL
jgi:hypothetical protein